MFRCDICNDVVDPAVQPIVIVTKREKTYPPRTYHVRGEARQDRGGVGWEIARETAACETCAKKVAIEQLKEKMETAA